MKVKVQTHTTAAVFPMALSGLLAPGALMFLALNGVVIKKIKKRPFV